MKTFISCLCLIAGIIVFSSCEKDDPKLSSDKSITSFSFRAVDNPGLPSDIQGSFAEDEINFTLPAGVSLKVLTPTIALPPGTTITPASGVALDFSNPVTYTVTAMDKSTKTYSVSVTATQPVLSSDKTITSFTFLKADNPGLSDDIEGTISGQAIACTIPAGVSATALKPTIAHTGTSVTPSSGTAIDFTLPVVYTVVAQDGSDIDYSVTVSVSASGPVVYVAGGQVFSGTRYARIWKDGTGTSITNGTYNSSLSSIFVSNNTMYISGNQAVGNSVASYWAIENGVHLPTASLKETSNDSYANSIYVSDDNDVYVAGREFHSGIGTIAKVWKNGTATHLTTKAGGANSVFVSGSDVYVAGWEETTTGMSAKVWKNGSPTTLSEKGQAKAVFVSANGDVYVAGQSWNGTANVLTVWKNGAATEINPNTVGVEAYSIFVDNNDVYIAGEEIIDNKWRAATWKNGIRTILSDVHGSSAQSVFVHSGDVYVAGWEPNDAGKLVAILWKNGVPSALATDAFAYSVFVK